MSEKPYWGAKGVERLGPVPSNVTVLSTQDGDWSALYLDGRCVFQGHSIRPRDIFDALQMPFRQRSTTDAEEAAAMDSGRLPDALT